MVQVGGPQAKTCLVILTREATVWTAPLHDTAAFRPAATAGNADDFAVQAASQVDIGALLSTASADASGAPASQKQLYGKSICFCPAAAMHVASLGNADDEDCNITWLMRLSEDGTTVGQVSAVHVTSTPPIADSASSADSAGLQHPDPESDAEHMVSEEEADQGQDDCSDNDSMDAVMLPSVERSYAIPVLPVSRHEMQSPGLVLGVPSHGLPGLVATVFESAHSNGTGCALVSQIQDMQVSNQLLTLTCCNLPSCRPR